MHKAWLSIVALALVCALLPAEAAQAAPLGSTAQPALNAASPVEEVATCVRRRACGPRGCVMRRVCRRW